MGSHKRTSLRCHRCISLSDSRHVCGTSGAAPAGSSAPWYSSRDAAVPGFPTARQVELLDEEKREQN